MPHQCTNCARVFDDGSKEMLSGCPDCGGNKFQFRPDGVDADDADPDASADPARDDDRSEPPAPPEPPESPTSSTVARTVGKTAATVRDIVGGSDDGSPSIGADRPDPIGSDVETGPPAREDTAQASARTDLVSADELPTDVASEGDHRFRPVGDGTAGTPDDPAGDATPVTEPAAGPTAAGSDAADDRGSPTETAERPDLEELRAELNDQFESIKVLSPGQYELNLMELYDREEYIVALQEDGRYSIQVPENFRT